MNIVYFYDIFDIYFEHDIKHTVQFVYYNIIIIMQVILHT